MTSQVIAIGLIWSDDKRILVGRRSDDQVLGGFDELPGGKCEPGESIEHAVVRECKEETSLNVSVIAHRLTCRHTYPHGELELHFFDCRWDGESNDEHPSPQFQWWTVHEVLGGNFPPANRELLQSLADRPHPV